MNYEVLNAQGNVTNIIVADEAYMQANYPDGNYRLREEMTGKTAATQAVIVWTVLAFRSRFTDAEKRAIYSARANSIDIQIWLDDLAAADEVRSDDPRMIAGVQGLEAAGLLTAGRASEIMGAA